MTAALDNYLELKRRYEAAVRDVDRVAGALDQVRAGIKRDYDVSLKAAGRLLEELRDEQRREFVAYEKKRSEFEKALTELEERLRGA